jgi:hypothetical protein
MVETSASAATDFSKLRSVEAQLHYAGEIDGTPRFDVDAKQTRIAFDPRTVTIYDARSIRDEFSLDREGFSLMGHQSDIAISAEMRALNSTHEMEANPINDAYHREVAEFLRQLTGARDVIGQRSGLIVRTSIAAKNRTWAGPAGFVHLDYVPETARMFREISIAAEDRVIAPYRRFAVYQTWRVISQPPQDNTLALCDGRSVFAEDAVVFDAVVGPKGKPGSEFQARMCKYRPDHKWFYFANMYPGELLVFKGYDSEIPNAMNAMHTAFNDPSAGVDSIPRESIEARFFAFFE